jgi:membrane-bound acyltransferase YfiQ involved in biofilm formation
MALWIRGLVLNLQPCFKSYGSTQVYCVTQVLKTSLSFFYKIAFQGWLDYFPVKDNALRGVE